MRFLFFDRVVELATGVRMQAVKDVALSEEFFPGHFARKAVVPGSILTEAVAQVAGWLVIATSGFEQVAIVSIIRDVEFLCDVQPGDQLVLNCQILDMDKRRAWAAGGACVGGQEVLRVGQMMFALLPVADDAMAQFERDRFGYFSGGYLAGGHTDA
jgi:3-hydroxyacyl-[acyl-carrier-protein] dehydratase